MHLMAATLMLAWLAARPWAGARAGAAMDVLICAAVLWQWAVDPAALVFHFHIEWLRLPAYMLGGAVLFLGSVLLTTNTPGRYFTRCMASFPRNQGLVLLRLALLAPLHEEFVWRIGAQTLLAGWLGSTPAVLIVATSFTLWHRHRVGTNLRLQAELFLFSLVLGFGLITASDPLLVIALHAVRNVLIFCTASEHVTT